MSCDLLFFETMSSCIVMGADSFYSDIKFSEPVYNFGSFLSEERPDSLETVVWQTLYVG